MQDIINGKKYDTATAEIVVSWNNGFNATDFNYLREDLYKTPSGNWFIHANRDGRELLKPIEPYNAKEWLIKNGSIDEVEEHFGKVEEA